MRKPKTKTDPDEAPQHTYRGFPLGRVTWGYREQFRHLLDNLFAKGLLNEESRQPEDVCAPLLAGEARTGYDYVLKEFLAALDAGAGWLLRVPALFKEWRDLGADFAAERVYMGKRYFQLWGEGHFPREPDEVSRILQWAAHLMETDPEVAFSFLVGYPELRSRLALDEVPAFIENGLAVYQRSRENAVNYFQIKLKSAEATAEHLSRACRFDRVKDRLGRLYRAVAGRSVQLDTLDKLDSDDLIDCGSGMVCGCDYLYLPGRVSAYPDRTLNRAYYVLATLYGAACYRFGGYCAVHGNGGGSRISDLCHHLDAPDVGLCSFLFQVTEVQRLRTALETHYPGATRLIREVSRAEARMRHRQGGAEMLLNCAAGGADPDELPEELAGLFRRLAALAEECDDHRTVLKRLLEDWPGPPPRAGDRQYVFRAAPLSFFPDFDFPLRPTAPPSDAVVMDLSSDARDQSLDADAKTPATEEAEAERTGGGEGDEEGEEEEGGGAVQAAYLYDEWNGLQNEYYRDWCKLREVRPEPRDGGDGEDEAFRRRVEHVKKLFQRLRPDVVVKEKYLESGDYIDIDSLVRFVTLRKAKVSPQVRFWMKPRLNRRDVAVALLVDCSGSTGRESGRRDVLGVEKQAARILATGLGELGDRFGIFGFTGNGREQCIYQVFKDFDEDWDRQATDRLMAVRPGSSTRIGVALRHTGQKLARLSARTRLIILLTDGRPMDTDYDPQTRYAHYDVRKACEENNSLGIDTFCIAIDIESREELDLMFPRRRYVVLDDAGDLPDALTRSYLKLTRA